MKVTPHRIKLATVLTLVVLVVIVLFQNNVPTPFNLLFWHPVLPPSLLLVGVFLAGAAAGAILWAGLRAGRER